MLGTGTFIYLFNLIFFSESALTREGKVEETSHHTAQFMIKQAAAARRVLI